MKKTTITNLICMLLCLLVFPVFAQSKKTSGAEVAYHRGTTLYTADVNSNKKSLVGEGVKIQKSRIAETSDIVYFSDEISGKITVPQDMVFYQGLKSPFENKWVYLERTKIGSVYNLWLFDAATGKKTLLFTDRQGTPEAGLAFKPIAWSESANEIYLEALHFDSHLEHEGVLRYNLANGTASRLAISTSYVATPVLSPDRTHFAYLATTAAEKDLVHGVSDAIMAYNIATGEEKTLVYEPGVMYYLSGWTQGEVKKESLLGIDEKDNSRPDKTQAIQQLNFKLPWDNGTAYCVSRHGSPAPTGTHTATSYCGGAYVNFTPHSYVAIDFDTPDGVYDAIRAVAPGTVTFAGISGSLTSGYGRLVIVTHSDNTLTYYAHLNTIGVTVGQCVGQGQVLGDGGTTGSSTGDHLHFEWRSAGGSTLMYATFDEPNGTPRQAYRYTSGNTPLACGATSDNVAPTTSVSTSATTYANDFTANFTDGDNVGVTDRFYQALEFTGTEWRGNRGNGFFNDNFGTTTINPEWTVSTGTWSTSATAGRLRQTNTTLTNTNINTALTQGSGQSYLYQFAAKLNSTTGARRFGIHIFTDNATATERNNSYLIWFSGDDQTLYIYETVANVLNTRATAAYALTAGGWNDYKVTYNSTSGVIRVFINNTLRLSWTDATPLTSGTAISLRTNGADVEFDDIKVYKSRSTSRVITVGPESNQDCRRQSPNSTTPACKVNSLVTDAAGNWSAVGNRDLIINWSTVRTEGNNNSLNFYPNPVEDGQATMSYELSEAGHVKIAVYDIQGKLVLDLVDEVQQAGAHQITTDKFAPLNAGMYIIKAQTKDQSSVLKVVKK